MTDSLSTLISRKINDILVSRIVWTCQNYMVFKKFILDFINNHKNKAVNNIYAYLRRHGDKNLKLCYKRYIDWLFLRCLKKKNVSNKMGWESN